MNRALCSCVVVELDVEGFDAAGEDSMILVRQLAGCDLAFYCFNFYWCAVFVAARHHDDVFAFQSQVACVDVG